MNKILKAKFKNGEFSPLVPVDGLKEGETIEIILKKNIKNLEFVGMWKDRKDIKDGLDYVKKIRSWIRFG
ncbi:antitoxin family protein [Candidatus Woesearchaeota archaeon]|nr:antitoxin family protein [Candidatus Woesearchaeota archaeon]